MRVYLSWVAYIMQNPCVLLHNLRRLPNQSSLYALLELTAWQCLAWHLTQRDCHLSMTLALHQWLKQAHSVKKSAYTTGSPLRNGAKIVS